jgi:hypothetical protein
MTVTYSSITGKLLFTGDGVTDFKFNLDGNQPFADLIGFIAQDGTLAGTQTSDYVVNIKPVEFIYLRSSELSHISPIGNQHGTVGQVDLNLFRFDLVNSNFGRTEFSNLNKLALFKCQGSLKELTLEFFDRDGNSIDFNNNPWVVDIEFLCVV